MKVLYLLIRFIAGYLIFLYTIVDEGMSIIHNLCLCMFVCCTERLLFLHPTKLMDLFIDSIFLVDLG